MTTDDQAAGDDQPASFESRDPATDAVIGSHRIHTAAEVNDAVGRARVATEFWSALSFAQRSDRLTAWAGALTRRRKEFAELIHAETGKPRSDAQLEIVIAIEQLSWAARNARKVLRTRKVSAGLLGSNDAATVDYLPYGVVGVIGPWNYPVFTPMGSIGCALAAGNTVVYKPSEFAPGVGPFLVQTLGELVPEAPILQLVTGFGDTGTALCRAGVDKIAFTGSAVTARKVMHACADGLVPVIVEAGGKDPLLVDADADLSAAATAAVWGGLVNAGQTCVGVERIYVHHQVYDDFVDRVVGLAGQLRAEPGGKIGPMTTPGGPAVVRRHVQDALAHGASALVGGDISGGDISGDDISGGELAGAGRFVQPTVLVDVPEDALAVQEETFGPVLTIAAVPDMDEAVRLANASVYGLGASVFSRRRGAEIAGRLHTGMVSVNSVIAFTGIPALPFGGVKQSGFGRVHGADGLREFSTTRAVARQRFAGLLRVATFARTARTDRSLATISSLRRGRRHGPQTAERRRPSA